MPWTTLWVGSLGERCTEKRLHDLFSRFGALHQVEIGVPRGAKPGLRFALVAFASEQAARDAREALDGREEPGVTAAPFKIEYSRARPAGGSTTIPPTWQRGGGGSGSSKGFSKGPARGGTLWIGNLRTDLSEADLAWELGEYGHVVGMELHPSVGAQAQHAIATYEREQDAEYAIDDLDGFQGLWISAGRPLKVRWARTSSAQHSSASSILEPGPKVIRGHVLVETPSALLWVGSLGQHVSVGSVRQAFSQYGPLAFITEPQAPKAGASLFCFVCFASRDGAHRAKQALDGSLDSPLCSQNDRNRRLKLRYAQPATEDAKSRLKPVWQAAPGGVADIGSFQAGPRTPVKGPAVQSPHAQQAQHATYQPQQEEQQRLLRQYGQRAPDPRASPHYSPSHAVPPRHAAAAAEPAPMSNGHHQPASSAAATPKATEEEDDLPRCAFCGVTDDPAAGVALRLCTGCSCLRYCSEACQHQHWQASHHAQCAALGSLLAALCTLSPAAKQLLGAGLQRPFGPEAGLVRRVLKEAGGT